MKLPVRNLELQNITFKIDNKKYATKGVIIKHFSLRKIKRKVELHSDIPLCRLEFSLLLQKTRMEQLEKPEKRRYNTFTNREKKILLVETYISLNS
jgi:hypothetical protein